jgi:hypothetical protein
MLSQTLSRWCAHQPAAPQPAARGREAAAPWRPSVMASAATRAWGGGAMMSQHCRLQL